MRKEERNEEANSKSRSGGAVAREGVDFDRSDFGREFG